MKKLHILGFVSLFIFALFNVAEAVPIATTQVAKLSEVKAGGYGFDQYDSGPQPFEQATATNLSVTNATTQGYASAVFGPGIPQVGLTSASSEVATYNGIAEANLLASLLYFFEIQPIGANPGISQVPVLFSARGQGSSWRSGYVISQSQGVVDLFGNGISSGQARFEFKTYVVDETAYDPIDEESQTGGFNGTKLLNLYPNSTYGVSMTASSSVWAGPVGQAPYDSASGRSSSVVDPFIGFDQATFDDIMGQDTFPLNEYYRFVFSENLPSPSTPVPEPATMLLLGAGLIGLAGYGRKKFFKK